jgi:hypothetical protein
MVHPSGRLAAPAGCSPDPAAKTPDTGDVLLGWLTRLIAGLAIVAVLGIDAVTVGMATVSVQDQANTAAGAARDSYGNQHNVSVALKAAQASALESDSHNVISTTDFSISPTGAVTLHLHRTINTLVAHYLPIDGLKATSAVGSAQPVAG